MKRTPAEQCRRCGHRHDDFFQMIDPEGRWAVASALCQCGHGWTMIHTAPANLPALRVWISRGCEPAEGPSAPLRNGPWQEYRLEGLCPVPCAPRVAQGASLS